MKVGVLALQGDVAEHRRMLPASSEEVRTPADLDRVDALVIPGGESTTLTKLIRLSHLEEMLGKRIREGMPVLGTCAGLILLSTEVLGPGDVHPWGAIDVTVERNAYGPQVESFEADIESSIGPIRAAFIRAPRITRFGDDVEVLAEYGGRPVLVRQGPAVGCSFHPELLGDATVHTWFVSQARIG